MSKREKIPADCEYPQLYEIVEAQTLATKLQKYVEAFSGTQEQRIVSCKVE